MWWVVPGVAMGSEPGFKCGGAVVFCSVEKSVCVGAECVPGGCG